MNGTTILEPMLPTIKSAKAVKPLITAIRHGHAPEEMPPFFGMSADIVLVQNAKKDSCYMTSPRDAGAFAMIYHPGQAYMPVEA